MREQFKESYMKKDLFAFSKDDGNGGGTVRDGSSVSGTIRTSDGGSPNGAAVTLIDSAGEVVKEEVVGSNGAYTFTDVDNGTYTVEAALAGYATARTEPFTVQDAHIMGKDLTLQKEATSSVSGTISVSDSAGSPKGAVVSLKNSGGTTVGQVTVDDSGAYTFTGVADGDYTVEAALEGYTTGVTSSFTVYQANIYGKDLTLTKAATGYTVRGYIYNTDKTPAVGASVKLREAGGGELVDTTTDENGYYTLTTTKSAAEYFIRAKGKTSQYPTDSSYFTLTLGVPKDLNVTLQY
jgi:hypothetical protein